LEWLTRHPDPGALAELVKAWARETDAFSVNEPRYRLIVERITEKQWDSALLDSLNAPSFFARGSAIDVLVKRLSQTILRTRISGVLPKTEAVIAIQAFVDRFEHFPDSGRELLVMAWLYKTRREMIDGAAELEAAWRKEFGYRFVLRDFHLISRLGQDPLRPRLSRAQLLLQLAHALERRQHVRPSLPDLGLRGGYLLSQHADRLTMADLWNLYLLNEMLASTRVHTALAAMAARDQADNTSACGGLIFYENGRAEAKIYPGDRDGGQNDLVYKPSKRAIRDSRDCLFRFSAHFEKTENIARAGPDVQELRDADRHGFYGLMLTSIGADSFAAHYYNPDGIIVSLGTFPFKR